MTFRNSTHALIDRLQLILAIGDEIESRGERTLEARTQLLTLERPMERCIITPERRNNVFAAIAETVWLLAGRNDVSFLEHYLPRASTFSDDGMTWRAGYGPRLRNWYGKDQLNECRKLLLREQSTRRAVMSLFDPATDFVDSKDIPCNNWLHWLARDGELHLNVAVRSNDIMWGFSGINAFAWSVLQEVMASWLGLGVGQLTMFVSSLHLYDRHKERAQKIITRFPGITCYEYGAESPQFMTAWSDFETVLQTWFALESQTRAAPESIDGRLSEVADPLLRLFLQMIQLYNGQKAGWSLQLLDERIAQLPECDLAIAAYEYFHRGQHGEVAGALRPGAPDFWQQYMTPEGQGADADDSPVNQLVLAIVELHRRKTKAYGSSWKRRGEQISILANIARKVDRLENVANGALASIDNSLYDTVIDLLVYCLKYETYLADVDSAVSERLFGSSRGALPVPFSDSLEAFEYVLRNVDFWTPVTETSSVQSHAAQVRAAFDTLESCFTETALPCAPTIRLERLDRLISTSVELLEALRQEAPKVHRAFVASRWR